MQLIIIFSWLKINNLLLQFVTSSVLNSSDFYIVRNSGFPVLYFQIHADQATNEDLPASTWNA